MKVYVKKTTHRFDYPEQMEKILDYLNANGVLACSEKTVERMYREFSDEKYCAGWMSVDEELLEEFADWLADQEV